MKHHTLLPSSVWSPVPCPAPGHPKKKGKKMDASFVPPPLDPDESVIELGNAADLTLGEGKADKEDKRKIYNWRADHYDGFRRSLPRLDTLLNGHLAGLGLIDVQHIRGRARALAVGAGDLGSIERIIALRRGGTR